MEITETKIYKISLTIGTSKYDFNIEAGTEHQAKKKLLEDLGKMMETLSE